MQNTYMCDFETINDEDDCRVWAWCAAPVECPDNTSLGIDITGFMEFMFKRGGIFFFHNLKFDGGFIVDWLFRNGFQHVYRTMPKRGKPKKLEPGQFGTVISDMGQWYTVEICAQNGKLITLKDSLKLIPLPVAQIPKAYGLEESKLEIDYNEYRPVGHQLTQQEIDYVRADVIIVAKAIAYMFSQGQTKLTAASNALNDYKTRMGKDKFRRTFRQVGQSDGRRCAEILQRWMELLKSQVR